MFCELSAPRQSDWELLIDEFGNNVANAYRDAAIKPLEKLRPQTAAQKAPSLLFNSLFRCPLP